MSGLAAFDQLGAPARELPAHPAMDAPRPRLRWSADSACDESTRVSSDFDDSNQF
jgi:hypothetical protein